MDKIMIAVCFAVGLFAVLFCAHNAGYEMPFLVNKTAQIKAETELKRVEADHLERMALIEQATAPRTPALVIFGMVSLSVLCGAFAVALGFMVIRDRERRRFAEFQMQIAGKNRKHLFTPEENHGRLLSGHRDMERRAAP